MFAVSICLPLYLPILIFATSAISASNVAISAAGQLYALAAILMMALITAPVITAYTIKIT